MGDVNSSALQSEKNNRKQFEDYYEKGCQIGHGAFATVYRCTNKANSKQFALKRMDKTKMSRSELMCVREEINVLKRTKHKNIIKLHDVFDDGKVVNMVLELCRGKDLYQYLDGLFAKQQRLTEEMTAKIIHSVCKGLLYLHENGVVHRDIKPENILFGMDGSFKITDFGLCHYTKEATDYRMVSMKTACGSPHYAAPELVKGCEYNYKVDVWSLGVILYVMLSGSMPFDHANVRVLCRLIVRGKYDLSSEAWKGITDEAKDLVSKMLESDPEKRYSVEDVLRHPFIRRRYVDEEEDNRSCPSSEISD